jgi:TetR/AcrR family transcriptional repressor of nem operon
VLQNTPTPVKLQQALYELMWRQSYGRVTIDAICERAGVKKGSFYHAYPDKATLAAEAFEYAWKNEAKPWLDDAFSPSETPLIRLANWLDGGLQKTLQCQKEHGKIHGCPLFNVGSELSTLEPLVAAKVVEILRRNRRYITTALRDAQAENLITIDDPDEVARDVLTLVEGALTQARITNTVAPIHRLPLSVGRLIGATLPDSSNLTVS